MTKKTETQVVIVTASRDRWRIGRQFKAKQATRIPLDELSETEVACLESDTVLSLRITTANTEDNPEPATVPESDIIKAVVEDLTLDNFNRDGSPKVTALEALFDRPLTKSDVTAALAGLTDDQRAALKARLEAAQS